ncbi:MAG: hypothetical protein DMG39_27410 [Acidobacteria bacterium]|nr:MAG: hypothetical protein DMG39_27410 [Acidobacteriota bacterium]
MTLARRDRIGEPERALAGRACPPQRAGTAVSRREGGGKRHLITAQKRPASEAVPYNRQKRGRSMTCLPPGRLRPYNKDVAEGRADKRIVEILSTT